ncbi:FAD/NAD(P)-binding domain-containing protein [Hypoxylon sp. NC1633]|nr:FAD/NAD(P)-binding domain-containing protein [Hypoxylon sp. NC1633]
MANEKFRVIIVGAGPNGLYMAHALAAANIDFVVLEQQPTVVRHQGALVIMWPQSARLFDQLGLYDEVKDRSFPMHSKADLLANGQVLDTVRMWEKIQQHHSYPMLPILRSDLIDVLYHRLPNRETLVKTGAELSNITVDESGVKVFLKDGTLERGSVVIGIDGVHSKTRELMHELKSGPNKTSSEEPMVATYHSVYAKAPNLQGIEAGIFYETRGTGASTQLVTSQDMLYFVLTKALPEPTTKRTRYTRDQMEEHAQSFFDTALAPGVKLQEVWTNVDKESARLVNQEEGIAKLWHHGRIVLVGDSVNKTTSISGLGANCGMHSAAVLASEIQKLLASNPDPDTQSLDETFARYQRFRSKESKRIYDFGYNVTRRVTWSTWSYWFTDRVLLRWLNPDKMMETNVYPMISNGQVLSYVPFEGKKALVPWRRVPDAKV